MKFIYTFEVDVNDEKVKVFFAKPSNSDIEDGEYIYAQKFNKLLNDGFMSRAMMSKKFDDIGGLFSEKRNQDVSEDLLKLIESKRTIEFFEGAEDLTEDQEVDLKRAKEVYIAVEKDILEKDMQLHQMYSQSADAKAEEHMIKHYILNGAFFYEKIKKGDQLEEQVFPIFEGSNSNEKQAQLDLLLEDPEEDDSSLTKKKKKLARESLVTFQRVAALWYQGLCHDQESTEEAFEKFYQDEVEEDENEAEEAKEAEEDKPSPPKKKAAKKKTKNKKD
jgi:hypothetical protein